MGTSVATPPAPKMSPQAPEISPKPSQLLANSTGTSVQSKSKPEKPTKPKPELKPKPEVKPKSKPEVKPKSKPEMPIILPKPSSNGVNQRKPLNEENSSLNEEKHSPNEIKPPSLAPRPSHPQPSPQSQPSSQSQPSPHSQPPPPPRNYKPTKNPNGPPDLDLALNTGWFAASGSLQLPPSLQGLNYSTSFSAKNNFSGTENTRTVTVTHKNLSITTYRFDWLNNDISSVKSTVENHKPSPLTTKIPLVMELNQYSEQFGNHVASWCEHAMGKQIGRGECWDLAHDSLSNGCGKHAFVSTYTHHGFPILAVQGTKEGPVSVNGYPQLDDIKRGDIFQYYACKFYNGGSRVTSTAGAPDHTAVVLSVNGDIINVAEQNVNGARYVVEGKVRIGDLIEGKMWCYRPMPAEWGR